MIILKQNILDINKDEKNENLHFYKFILFLNSEQFYFYENNQIDVKLLLGCINIYIDS